MADFRIAVGETSPAFQRTLTTDTGAAVDLTGATVTFSLTKYGLAYIVDAAVTVVTAASGIVKYVWQTGDLTDTGIFYGTFKVVYADTSIEYFEYVIEVIDGAGIVAPVTPPAQDFATQAELDAHINDTTAAHAGTAISNTPAGNIAATTVQAAINELDTEKLAKASNLSDLANAATARTNLGLGTAAVTDTGTGATNTILGNDARLTDARTPTGTAGGVLGGTYPNPSFAADMATQAELDAHTGSSTAHTAAKIVNVAAGNIAATTVQAALNELDTEKIAKAGDSFTGTLAGTLAASTDDAITTKVTGDTNPRLVLNADGKIELGPGNATQDVSLYRFAAGVLRTDNKIHSYILPTDPTTDYVHNLQYLQTVTAGTSNTNGTLDVANRANAGAGAHTGTVFGIKSSAGTSGTYSGTLNLAICHQSQIFAIAGSTITNAYGYVIQATSGTGTIGTATGFSLANVGTAGTTTVYGINVSAQTAGTAGYGVAIGAATTASLWLSSNTDSTTPVGGVLFGLSKDTNLYRSAANSLKTDDALTVALGLTASGGITIGDAKDIALGSTTGTKIGTATTEKLAFHNATPVVQRAGAAQAAVATTAATNSTPYGYSTAAQADAIITLLNEIRATLVEKGIMKGSA